MAISFVGAQTAASSDTDVATVSKPSGTALHDVMVAFVWSQFGDYITTPPAGWDPVEEVVAAGNQFSGRVYVKVAGASEPAEYLWDVGADSGARRGVVSIATYRGVSTTSPVDAAGAVSATTATVAAPSVGTSLGAGMVLVAAGFNVNAEVSHPAGTVWRQRRTDVISFRLADFAQVAAGSTGTTTFAAQAAASAAFTVALLNDNEAPFAPTVAVPAAVDIAQPTVVGVGFNDPDAGDSPSAAEIQYRRTGVGAAWTPIHRLGSHSSVTIPSGSLVEGDYEVQGRSTDALGIVGPWSSSVFFSAAPQPDGPTITDPVNGATIPSENYTGTISYPTMDSWEFRVLGDNAGVPDESNVVMPWTARPGSSRTFTMTGLPNGVTVHPQVRTEVGGLWSPVVSHANPVAYTAPAKPTITVHENSPVGAISMFATHPAPSGSQPSVVSVDWQRQDLDASGNPIADAIFLLRGHNLVPTAVFEDWQIVSGKRYRYRARVWGSNDVSTFSDWGVGVSVTPANTVVYSGGHISEFDPDAPVI